MVLLARRPARFEVPLACGPRASTSLYVLLWSVLSLWSLVGSPVRAEPGSPPEGYSQLIDEAVNEASQAHFEEARALFAQAHALYPNARTLRGLGIMAYELRSYAESISFYEQALLSKERPLDAALRADAKAVIERARRFVAELKLAIVPPETHILIDMQPVTLPASNTLRLNPGAHTLTFEAPGYRRETRTLAVRGGETVIWSISLSLATPAPAPIPVASSAKKPAEPSPATPAAPGGARDEEPRRLYRNPWLWIGVTLAAGAIAAGVGVALKPDAKTVQDDPTTSAQTPPNGVLITLVRKP